MEFWNMLVGSAWFNLLLMSTLLILLIMTFMNFIKIKEIRDTYKKLMMEFGNGQDLNEKLNEYLSSIQLVSRETEKLKVKTEHMQKNMEKCIQKVGMVRYKAHLNEGSDLCFALALLDFEDNGVVINGIYSRDNTTTTYAKPIENGKSKYPLVNEEKEAIEIAKHNGYQCFLKIQ